MAEILSRISISCMVVYIVQVLRGHYITEIIQASAMGRSALGHTYKYNELLGEGVGRGVWGDAYSGIYLCNIICSYCLCMHCICVYTCMNWDSLCSLVGLHVSNMNEIFP